MTDAPVWMPFFIGDYLADTIGLSHAEHGAYVLSIFKYWQKGEALSDSELREVTGRQINRVAGFYIWEGGCWHHKRIDHELSLFRKRMQSAREKSMKGVAARAAKVK